MQVIQTKRIIFTNFIKLQFWLFVSSGSTLKCLTIVAALAFRMVWLIQAEPISICLKSLLVSLVRSPFGIS